METLKFALSTFDPRIEDCFDDKRLAEVTLRYSRNLRIILGDPDDDSSPDLLVEKAIGQWKIFVHPGETDPICLIRISQRRIVIVDTDRKVLLKQTF